jgi:predicted ribosome quality control (RQC) complex YloA/Tae2 family protein
MTFPEGTTPPAETPETPPAGAQETPATPAFVTKEQLDTEIARLNKIYETKMNAFFRGTESSNDKFKNAVQQRITTLENAAQQLGLPLTPSQRQQITDQATLEELQKAAQTVNPGETQEQFTEEEMKVNNAAQTLINLSGITFDDNDPEGKIIDEAAETGDAQKYLDAVKQAIDAKKTRLAKGGSPATERTPEGGAPGAIGGTPNSNPIANITDPNKLWELAKAEGKI